MARVHSPWYAPVMAAIVAVPVLVVFVVFPRQIVNALILAGMRVPTPQGPPAIAAP